MKILITFVLFINVCYANNTNLKSPSYRCNPIQKTGVDEPSVRGPFEIMKLIPLSQKNKKASVKYYAQVDDEDYDYLIQWSWHVRIDSKKKRKTIYAGRCVGRTALGTRHTILMHREILKLTDPNEIYDHIDRNGLNNQKSNLRKATRKENSRNKSKSPHKSSKYLGVNINRYIPRYRWKDGVTITYGKEYVRWIATIRIDGKLKYLGRYINEEDAAKAYDAAAKKYFGEFANLNFKNE